MVADIEKMMAVNVTALMVITRLFTPGMIERKKGHVINIGSIAGYETCDGWGTSRVMDGVRVV